MNASRLVIPTFGFALVHACVAYGSDGVSIEGGADKSGQNYEWIVSNESDSPIVFVEFPQYGAAVQITPTGWSSELTNPRGVGGRDGVFTANAKSVADGIARGSSMTFRLTVTVGGTPRGRGDVTVRFEDGREVRVSAEVPVKTSLADRNVSLIGLSVIFGGFLLVRFLRRRKGRVSDGHPPTENPAA